MKPITFKPDQLRMIIIELQEKSDHEILDVPWNVSDHELKFAWKRMAQRYHPSRFDPKSLTNEHKMLLNEICQIFSHAYRRLKKETSPIELLPPPDKIGRCDDPLDND
ncbi:hypothetical protein JW979_03595 [bacterium]|nr:hypothetical protein [candidate division CSSED10-310 bacterium]